MFVNDRYGVDARLDVLEALRRGVVLRSCLKGVARGVREEGFRLSVVEGVLLEVLKSTKGLAEV